MRNDWRARNHPGYWAFVLQRLSGVLLALFLPVHFWALSQALHGAAALDAFLAWTASPLAQTGELGLVVLLALHLTGGIRLLMLEFLDWREWHKGLFAAAIAASAAAGLGFALVV